jgi:UDP-glucose:glycoprotein glucosyltransferase
LDRELLSKEWKNLFWDFTEFWLLGANEDSDSYTAKDCLKKIVNYGKSVLSEPLASVFEFSLTLRSASPRLVLHRQLAEDSLSSFPLADDSSLNPVNEGVSEPTDIIKSKRDEVIQGVPIGICCWVDIGSAIFFHMNELQLWLQSPNKV